MRLRVRPLSIQAGGSNIAILGENTASRLGVHSSDRLQIVHKNKSVVAIVNVSADFPQDCLGVYEEVSKKLDVRSDDEVEAHYAESPESLHYVQEKIRNERLRKSEINLIIKDVVERHLSDIELAAFLTALQIHGVSMDENEALSRAMADTGSNLVLGRKPILDKHSIGGIPGDKTTILLVPIVAAAGFTIPKTSSRAVTSPAGTADRVETLCPVSLSVEEIREVVNKTNGCMVWGGALELAPADDIFIRVEYPLAIDPMLLPSIMSKKKAIGATHVVLDIPTGRGAKIKTNDEANDLAADFIELGRRLGIRVECGVTFGEQPLGHTIGPALEAREALSTIMGKGPADLREKATSLAGILLEMVGLKDGKHKAEELLKSGKAEQKLREIMEAQGGNPQVKVADIGVGDKKETVTTDMDGEVLWLNNEDLVRIAKEAGAPKEKGAGVMLRAKLGDHVKKGDALFDVYAERATRLEATLKLAADLHPIGLSRRPEDRMLISRIPARAVHRKASTLES